MHVLLSYYNKEKFYDKGDTNDVLTTRQICHLMFLQHIAALNTIIGKLNTNKIPSMFIGCNGRPCSFDLVEMSEVFFTDGHQSS